MVNRFPAGLAGGEGRVWRVAAGLLAGYVGAGWWGSPPFVNGQTEGRAAPSTVRPHGGTRSRGLAARMGLGLVAVACLLAGCAGMRGGLPEIPGTGEIMLPPGEFELHQPLVIPAGARDLVIAGQGTGTVLRAADDFAGLALIVLRDAANVTVRDLTIDGNRAALARPAGLPPSDVPFIEFTPNNGIAADSVDGLTIENVLIREVAGFAILAARCETVEVVSVGVRDSGSRNELNRNNTTGGVLFEEGTAGFTVRRSYFNDVLGNGVWTHSLYTSPRNRDGVILENSFNTIGRDAIQVGHATNVRVENNTGNRIGYPVEAIDVEGGGIPVGIDTAGDVDKSVYRDNIFHELNGKCIDLDGFHDGGVVANTCINRKTAADYPFGHFGIVMNNTNPDMQSENILIEGNYIEGMKFGGIFVIGSGHRIVRNKLININTAGCSESAETFGCSHFPGEPDLLRSGVYLGQRAERPAVSRGNLVEENTISGHRMASRCVGFAPEVVRGENEIGDNSCTDQAKPE